MTTTIPKQRLRSALTALLALATVVVGVPVVMVAIGAVPDHLPTIAALRASMSRPDTTGTYFRIAAAVIIWAAWAIFTISTVREIVAVLRYRGPRPALTVDGLRRLTPAGLVAAVAALMVATPTIAGLATSARAHPLPAPPAAPSSVLGSAVASGQPNRDTDPRTTVAAPPAHPTYRVRRYDSLWSIAARYLPGDPAHRYRDIKRLNPSIGPDNVITPGRVLTLPPDAHSLPLDAHHDVADPGGGDRVVTVVPGDTLSGIAAHHDLRDWTELWTANRDRPEPDGRLADPDYIEPGWAIDLPDTPPNPICRHPSAATAS